VRNFRQKLAGLQRDERRFAAAAFACAPFVEVALRTVGLQRTLGWVERLSAATRRDRDTWIAPDRAAQIIDGVYRFHPLAPGKCLPRALLHYGLQRQRGADVRFVVGVKRPDKTSIEAHAWVEAAMGPAPATEFSPILRT
jgi:hypothetical protein